jgi:hypothetical protein
MNRTPDLLITNELLYRLSYTGFSVARNYSVDGYFSAKAGSFLATGRFFNVA